MFLQLLILGLALAWGLILALCWLCWQLLRQNGRLLLRLEELEKRLNELEFGEGGEPQVLQVGSEAPAFNLPDLAGERKSLAQFRGQPVLMVFFNPDCGFCRELMPKLAVVAAGFQPAVVGGILPPGKSAHSTESLERPKHSPPTQASSTGLEARLNGRQGCPPPQILIITTGEPEKNRQLFAEHKIGCPVLLQNDGEVAKVYQVNGTPAGYLVNTDGKIASGLAIGAEALLKLASRPAPLTPALSPPEGERENAGNGGDGRADRFSQRSVARSKIKRDGLKAGTPAPDFCLPRLDGRGDFTLSELRGKRVLLVFSSPQCGPCNALAPELEKFHRAPLTTTDAAAREVGRATPCAPPGGAFSQNGAQKTARPTLETTVVMISQGETKESRAKVKEHSLTFPIVLQQQWEISRRYAMFATPIAYLINEQGVIIHDVAAGVEPILTLMNKVTHSSEEPTLRIS